MRIRLKSIKRIEKHGRVQTYRVGAVIDVGKQAAQAWIKDGSAIPWAASPQKRKRRARRSPQPIAGKVIFPAPSELLLQVRAFWFSNTEGAFACGGKPISRSRIQAHGGPAPEFNKCELCQRSEWLSRTTQSAQFSEHDCPTSAKAQRLCAKQGFDHWAQTHQNFGFMFGNDKKLGAPRCAYILSNRWYSSLFRGGGSQMTLNKRRALAQACQVDVYRLSDWKSINWSKYDFVFMDNSRMTPLLPGPPIPILMFGQDHWKGNPQETLDHYKPRVFITPFKASWITNLKIPTKTEVRLHVASASQFFTRPNLSSNKSLDLLCTGAKSKGPDGPYGPRIILHDQILQLPKRYKVGHSHQAQFGYAHPEIQLDDVYTILNKYSEHLGSARYTIFGACQGLAKDVLLYKYYETLGSGAIPIMPTVPDLAEIGVKAGVHYIPVDTVMNDNERLADYLDNYDEHKRIAQAAVKWHKENADGLLFNGFEDAVRIVTDKKYPRRLCG